MRVRINLKDVRMALKAGGLVLTEEGLKSVPPFTPAGAGRLLFDDQVLELDAEPVEIQEQKCKRLVDHTEHNLFYHASPAINQEFDNIYAILRGLKNK